MAFLLSRHGRRYRAISNKRLSTRLNNLKFNYTLDDSIQTPIKSE